MLMKGTMAIIDQWSIPISFRGGATRFDLSLSVQGQRSVSDVLHKMTERSLLYTKYKLL